MGKSDSYLIWLACFVMLYVTFCLLSSDGRRN